MGRITIAFPIVEQKTEDLRKRVEQHIMTDIPGRYDTLRDSLEQSRGNGMDAIREDLGKEKEAVLEIGAFMLEMLSFIQDSSEAFKRVDVNHEEVMKTFI